MIAKHIKYTDYDGVEREETYMFNLTKAEVIQMDLRTVGGMEKLLENIVKKKDVPELTDIFVKLVRESYGVKSPDGRRFIKSPELFEEFSQTEAYSELIVELLSNQEKATEFFKGILPEIPNTETPAVAAVDKV